MPTADQPVAPLPLPLVRMSVALLGITVSMRPALWGLSVLWNSPEGHHAASGVLAVLPNNMNRDAVLGVISASGFTVPALVGFLVLLRRRTPKLLRRIWEEAW